MTSKSRSSKVFVQTFKGCFQRRPSKVLLKYGWVCFWCLLKLVFVSFKIYRTLLQNSFPQSKNRKLFLKFLKYFFTKQNQPIIDFLKSYFFLSTNQIWFCDYTFLKLCGFTVISISFYCILSVESLLKCNYKSSYSFKISFTKWNKNFLNFFYLFLLLVQK